MPSTTLNMRVYTKKIAFQMVPMVLLLMVAAPVILNLYRHQFRKREQNLKRDIQILRHREAMDKIACEPEDYHDTDFIKQVKANVTVLIPDLASLQKLSREELSFLYHRYIENLQYFCYKIARIGEIHDGGWDVCEETRHRPRAPCLVYSFGINHDFTFDDATVDEYGCEVHSFHPSMEMKDYHRRELNYYYNLCIASNDTTNNMGWVVKRFNTIKSMLCHQRKKISIVKIDIEEMEWEVLEDMLQSYGLENVDNIMVKFHLDTNWPPTEANRDVYYRGLLVLKGLYDNGFRIFWTHRNTAGSLVFKSKCKQILRVNCHEVSFVRIFQKLE